MNGAIENLVNQISNQQNEIKLSLDSISQNISSFNGLFSEFSRQMLPNNGGFWNNYRDAVIGLIGVLVGAIIAYFFNERIRRFDAKARFAVQRKNLIYAPIYKEFLKLSEYLENNKNTYFLKIIREEEIGGWGDGEYYFGDERRQCGKFILWNDMRKDIRKNYFPPKVRKLLNKVSENIDKYSSEKKNIENKFSKILEEELEPIYSANSAIARVGISLPENFFSKKSYVFDEKKLTKDTNGVIDREDNKDIREKVVSIFSRLPKLIERKIFFEEHDKLASSIEETGEEVNKLVQFVINQYEYGEELEKYE